ncbi:DUF5130 family protein [Antrihabitans stalactiti]|uniref:DUF5130 family protein n=1 Tax=Antrihabitans stalactiti TaxID=2584121 RepID=A0A848K673_9NOCA|nr:DUF5130 family protein [Antrihabitans stalactiti]
MASGNRYPAVVESELPVGSVLTASGRVSAVHRAGEQFIEDPFTEKELIQLDDALTAATRSAKIRFNVYVGDLPGGAEAIFPGTPEAARSVLIAVSPNQRTVEVLSGVDVADRVTSRICQLGVTASLASFGEGELIDGIVAAIRVISAAINAP